MINFTDDIVNGGWSEWGNWDTCSVSCDGGTQRRTRECNNPTPEHQGNSCDFDRSNNTETRTCAEQNCPSKYEEPQE